MSYKKLYDDLYENGYHGNYKINNTRVIYSLIRKYFKKKFTVLDIGCSHGTGVKYLKTKGFISHGIDIANIAIELCESRKIENCKVACVLETGYPDDSFDGLISSDTFEHLHPRDLGKALSECKRILKPGGIFILNVATVPEINRDYDFVAAKHNLKNLHTSIFKHELWLDLIKRNFAIIEDKENPQKSVFVVT